MSENKGNKANRILLFITKVIGSISLRVIVVAILAIVFVYAIIRAYDFGYSIFTVKSTEEGDGMDVLVSITEDMSTSDIADLLVKKKLIGSPSVFKIQVMLFTSEKYVILPGTYTLNTNMSPQDMIQAMVGVKETVPTEPEHLWPTEPESTTEESKKGKKNKNADKETSGEDTTAETGTGQ